MSKTVIPLTVDTERLQRVKRNRQIQLQRWNYYEKELQKITNNVTQYNGKTKRIKFNKDIMLLEAVSRNDINEVKDLLSQGVNPNAKNIDGLTGLHQCCIDDFLEMAKLLLKYSADINAKDTEKWTPLHAAATCDNGQMCLLLSKHGADFLALNGDGNMPYDICEGDSALKVIESEMAKKGITQQQIDEARMVPEQKMLSDIKTLFQQKINLDQFDSQGAALIHVACSLGYTEVVQTLLEAGANYSLPDKDGWLPIHLAACWSHVDIVEFLVVFGADINVPNSSGDTIFDLCEPEIRDRLIYIKDHISDIKKNYNINRLPPYKGFRRSRGSSVRRTSVRQKNMLSKKEAKEEYIALNQTIVSSEAKDNHTMPDPTTNIPSTIDECSDVDSLDTNLQNMKVAALSSKVENNSSKNMISISVKKTNSSKPIPVTSEKAASEKCSNRQTKAATVVNIQSNVAPQSHIKSESGNNHTQNENAKTSIVLSEDKNPNTPKRASLTDVEIVCNVDALDKPKYVFKSNSESWDNTKEYKRSRKRECCVIL